MVGRTRQPVFTGCGGNDPRLPGNQGRRMPLTTPLINYPSRDVLSYRLGKSRAGAGGKYIGVYSLGSMTRRDDQSCEGGVGEAGTVRAVSVQKARNSHPALPDHATARVQFLTVAYALRIHQLPDTLCYL